MPKRRGRGWLLFCALLAAYGSGASGQGPQAIELTLERALERARHGSPAARSVLARIEEARGRLAGAAAWPHNPEIEAGGGPRWDSGDPSTDLEIGLAQRFETGGQSAHRVAAADAAVARAEASAVDTTRLLLNEVAATFYRSLYAARRLDLARDATRIAAETEGVARRRYESGAAGGLEESVASLAHARTRSETAVAAAERERTLGALGILLDVEPGAPILLRGGLVDGQPFELAPLIAAAESRADLRLLTAELEEAEADAELGHSMRWPDVGVHVGYLREQGADIAKGVVSLSLPVFQRGQDIEAIARARAGRTRLDLAARRRAVQLEVETAFAAYRRLREAVAAYERDGLALLDRSERLAAASYRGGEIGLAELLAVRRELTLARAAHLDLLLAAALARAELATAAGVSP